MKGEDVIAGDKDIGGVGEGGEGEIKEHLHLIHSNSSSSFSDQIRAYILMKMKQDSGGIPSTKKGGSPEFADLNGEDGILYIKGVVSAAKWGLCLIR